MVMIIIPPMVLIMQLVGVDTFKKATTIKEYHRNCFCFCSSTVSCIHKLAATCIRVRGQRPLHTVRCNQDAASPDMVEFEMMGMHARLLDMPCLIT